MESEIFAKFRSIIHREAGIQLTDEKKMLLENRLRKRLKA
ncbi:MAG: hypothetical protein KDD53_11845, partial [Bdellovibrionales bacterium]|nr:hypothetical protein [Bdellovibrionales bacterium]